MEVEFKKLKLVFTYLILTNNFFSKFVCVCVFLYMHMYALEERYTHLGMCVCRPEVGFVLYSLFFSIIYLFSDKISHLTWNSASLIEWLFFRSLGSVTVLLIPWLQVYVTMPRFYVGFWIQTRLLMLVQQALHLLPPRLDSESSPASKN